MRPPAPPPAQAQIPPLPQAPNDPTVNILELENPIKRTEEEKRRRREETKDAMHIKRIRQGDEKMKEVDSTPSQSPKEASTSKRKKSSRRRINIDDFPLGRGSSAYNLVADVRAQGPNITWSQLLHVLPKLRCQWSKVVSIRRGRIQPINPAG